MHSFFQAILTRELGSDVSLYSTSSIGGGCIHNGTKLTTSVGDYFLKWNSSSSIDVFDKEFRGLSLLSNAGIFTIPDPISFGEMEGKCFLLMEFIDSSARQGGFWSDFGRKLAMLHQKVENSCGLDHDNYIGSLVQVNNRMESWREFFVEMRLKPQLDLAINKGLANHSMIEAFDELYGRIPGIVPEEKPSLLHGDLWSGNVMVGKDGQVCLIDPAVYYGHREIEMAFTTLFGGFDSQFYSAYDEAYPRTSGFLERIDLYNIYPLLVHLNLFGGSYYHSVMRSVKKYL